MKNNSTWILLCLACMMTLSCSDKKNTADESEKGVSTVLPDTKNEVAVQILKDVLIGQGYSPDDFSKDRKSVV